VFFQLSSASHACQSESAPLPFTLVSSVRDLGIYLDADTNMATHVTSQFSHVSLQSNRSVACGVLGLNMSCWHSFVLLLSARLITAAPCWLVSRSCLDDHVRSPDTVIAIISKGNRSVKCRTHGMCIGLSNNKWRWWMLGLQLTGGLTAKSVGLVWRSAATWPQMNSVNIVWILLLPAGSVFTHEPIFLVCSSVKFHLDWFKGGGLWPPKLKKIGILPI